MNENEKYFVIGVEDGWIKVNKTNWNDYQYLRTKEKFIVPGETIAMILQKRTIDEAPSVDINLMIDWAYGKYSFPPPANKY